MKQFFALLLLCSLLTPAITHAQSIVIETENPEVIVIEEENENCPDCNNGGTGSAGRLKTKEAF